MLSGWQSWLDKQRKKCTANPWNTCEQPKQAASAESTFMEQPNWTPAPKRYHSLPRRVFGNLLPERNINEDVEHLFLKKLLKEHGLYNKHQTIQQRRRLKHLLELEQSATVSTTMPSAIDRETCLIELHSMSVPSSSELRRVSSLSALAPTTDANDRLDEAVASLSSITQEVKDVAVTIDLGTVSSETSTTSGAASYLETVV